MKNLVLVSALIILAACSSKYSYEFSFNTETTGYHEFDSKEAYCAGLQSASLNREKALQSRMELFAKDCEGTFRETP